MESLPTWTIALMFQCKIFHPQSCWMTQLAMSRNLERPNFHLPRDPVVPSQEVRLDPPSLHNSASNHLLRRYDWIARVYRSTSRNRGATQRPDRCITVVFGRRPCLAHPLLDAAFREKPRLWSCLGHGCLHGALQEPREFGFPGPRALFTCSLPPTSAVWDCRTAEKIHQGWFIILWGLYQQYSQ